MDRACATLALSRARARSLSLAFSRRKRDAPSCSHSSCAALSCCSLHGMIPSGGPEFLFPEPRFPRATSTSSSCRRRRKAKSVKGTGERERAGQADVFGVGAAGEAMMQLSRYESTAGRARVTVPRGMHRGDSASQAWRYPCSHRGVRPALETELGMPNLKIRKKV